MAQALSPTNSPTPIPAFPRAAVPRGFRAWRHALLVLIGMPLLAVAATKYVVLPSVKDAFSHSHVSALQYENDAAQDPISVFVAKIPLLNDARSDFRSVTLVGEDSAFKGIVNQNKALLRSVAVSTLDGQTLAGMTKAGALDQIRADLVANLNKALGSSSVKDVYLTVRPQAFSR